MGAPGIMFLNVNNVGISSFTLSLKDLESIDKFLHNLLHQKPGLYCGSLCSSDSTALKAFNVGLEHFKTTDSVCVQLKIVNAMYCILYTVAQLNWANAKWKTVS